MFNSIEMLVKDDYETFCNVSDRAASVKFQEMHLFFSKTPDPVSDSYFVTIQVSFSTSFFDQSDFITILTLC
jgi:hypothetical protein